MAEIQGPSIPAVTVAPAPTDKAMGVVGALVRLVPFNLQPLSDAAVTALATKPDVLGVQQLIATGGQQAAVRRVEIDDADYTLILADLQHASPAAPTWVVMNSALPRTLTWPAQASVPHPLMATVFVYQEGAGTLTIQGGAGVSINGVSSRTTAGRDSVVMLTAVSSNKVAASGGLSTSGAPVLVTPNSISGSAVQGSTLTLTASVVQPNTGTAVRQWLREHLTTGALTNVGTDSATYATVSGDIGFYVWCRETITVAGFAPLVVNSNKLIIVATAVATPQLAVHPTFAPGSSNAVGGSLTVSAGSWTNSPTSYSYQRKLNGANSGSPTVQAGATLAYTIQAGDAGGAITYTVVASNGSGASADTGLTQTPLAVSAGGIPVNTALPAITYSGTAAPGTVLTCSTGGWSNNPTSYAYRWKFVEVGNPSINGYIEPPQVTNTYTATSADAIPASQVSCEVTAINATGRSDSGQPPVIVTAVGPIIVATQPPPPPPPPPVTDAGPRFATTASGALTVSTNDQTIERFHITSGTNGITINPGVVGTIIQDCDIEGCSANGILDQGVGTVIRYNNVNTCGRGILCYGAANSEVYKNTLSDFQTGGGGLGTAIEVDYCNGVNVHDNEVTGVNYASDAASFFQSSFSRLVDNLIDVDIDNPNGAAFTMGDMVPIAEGGSGDPGHDNYVSGNRVYQTGGVPAGVFGSSGNTILEGNCLTAGIQAYNYSGVFVGVAVRNNYIDIAASFVPVPSVLSGYSTNIDLGASNVCP